jgi:hypothetical protein
MRCRSEGDLDGGHQRVNEGGVKKLTGTEVVIGRPLFKDFVTFKAKMLVRHPRTDFLSL